MVSKPKMSNRNRGSTSEHKSDIVAAAQMGSRSSSERERSTIEQMDHDVSILASRLEEEFSCLSNSASLEIWYIESGASAHMMGARECFSNYQEEQMNFKITMGNKAKCTPIGRGTIVFQTKASTLRHLWANVH